MWSSSRSIIVTIISTWASSSVPMESSMSLYLPGRRQFQPCSRYWVATVISPHWPPRISCILRAKSGSGPSGLASYCRALVWVNNGAPPGREWTLRLRRPDLPVPAVRGLPVPTPGPPVPSGVARERFPRSSDSASAVGEQDGQGERAAAVGPHDLTAELLGLPPDRPQPQTGQVGRRALGV